MVEALRERGGLDGSSILEIGAGAGTALVAMLDAGASSAVGVDISPAYERAASEVMASHGYADRVEWMTGDVVDLSVGIDGADVVFGNRVVCCYPGMEEMVDVATQQARRHVALSYPRNRWIARLATGLINLWMRINRNSFRTFVHDPEAIATRIESAGFTQVASGTTSHWHWVVWEAA